MSIRGRLFLPMLLLLIFLPLGSCLVFYYTASNYMQSLAERELRVLLELVEPVADRIFREPDDANTITVKERAVVDQAQAKSFLEEIKPIIRDQRGNAYLIILNHRNQAVYPKDLREQSGASNLYSYCAAQLAEGAKGMEVNTLQQLTLEGQQYIVSVLPMQDAKNTRVKYLIAYSPVYNTDSLLGGVALLVLGITASLASLSLLTMWAVTGRISRPLEHLCTHAARIGEGNFVAIEEKSGLREIDALSGAINDMSQRLGQYDAAQKTFFQNASHELRTPLMSIRGYAEGIQCGVFENAQEAAGIIVSESDRLTSLVDGLLTLSRMDNHRQALELQPILLLDFLAGAVRTVDGLALAKNVELRLRVVGDGLRVMADEELFGRILTNLLSNCIRYAKTVVTVRAWQEGEVAVITVSDDGSGFPEDGLAHLFERFYKGKGGNFGLGLSIAQSSAEYMGGKIRAYNNHDGAVFELRLSVG